MSRPLYPRSPAPRPGHYRIAAIKPGELSHFGSGRALRLRTGAPGVTWYRIEIGYRAGVDTVAVLEQIWHDVDGMGEVDLVDFVPRAHRGLGVDTGQAGVTSYDLPATESSDHKIFLNGTEQLSGWSISQGSGLNGRDQVVFTTAPAGQAITVDLVGSRVFIAWFAFEELGLELPARTYADIETVILWSVA